MAEYGQSALIFVNVAFRRDVCGLNLISGGRMSVVVTKSKPIVRGLSHIKR